MIDATVTQVGFRNGEFRIPRGKLKDLVIVVEKHIGHLLILPSMTPQGQRLSFNDDSARDLEQ